MKLTNNQFYALNTIKSLIGDQLEDLEIIERELAASGQNIDKLESVYNAIDEALAELDLIR